jgi:hypothetical protein
MAKTYYRVKFLVDQVTNQVIWLTTNFDSLAIPIFDQSLNMKKYGGYLDFDVWNSYVNFKLFYDSPPISSFSISKEYSQDFKDRFAKIQLTRTKATALDYINSGIAFQYETHNMAYKSLHSVANLKQERWINFFQQEHNCSREESIKLIDFKKEEYENIEFMLETIRYQAYNKIASASTLTEINELYECFCAKIFYAARPNLSILPALKKPF